MQIDKIKLTQIKKAEYNPRTISEENYAKLKNSVKNFGLVEPILINLKNNTIISGHQRYDVLTDLILADGNLAEKEFHLLRYGDLGLILDTDEPTLENEDYEKALNITLNNTNLTGDYDFEKLGELLDELNLADFDVSLTGFDDFEITDLGLNEDFIFENFETDDTSEDTGTDLYDMYSQNMKEPIYEPKESHHKISDLYKNPPSDLINKINSIENKELREFFKIRLYVFYKLNFEKIADYYAYQATSEEQKVFEALALVLLDKNKLIENGFAKLMEEYKNDTELSELK